MEITPDMFEKQYAPRYGTDNPERMHVPFWEWMVREGGTPYAIRQQVGVDWKESVPAWCFDRMGMPRTELPDGRTLCIGGEHEDFYDPDFFIYNDLIVLGPGDTVEIYGYPKKLFPPTDFHTATLAGNRIILIGGLGYKGHRFPGKTPVYSLDIHTYRIERIETAGKPPGWIFKHEAEFDPVRNSILIRGGETIRHTHAGEVYRDNYEEFGLSLGDNRWEQLTDRRA